MAVAALLFMITWGPADLPFVPAVLIAGFGIVLVCFAADFWQARTAPPPPAFSELAGPAEGTVEVHEDDNAGFWRDSRGFLWGSRVWFAGTGCSPCRFSPETYSRLRAWHDRGDLPVFVARARDRQWWWWRNAFYWESGDSEPEDVPALIVALETNDDQLAEDHSLFVRLEREREVYVAAPIPEALRRHVFERDGGRCVECGSPDLIQYHHIVPFWKGGDNEPENLQLLCAGCNRRNALVSVGLGRTTATCAGC